MSSERIGRNQKVAYSRHSVSGVARDSARERAYVLRKCFSQPEGKATGSMCKDLLNSLNHARSHSYDAIDMKRRTNFSCIEWWRQGDSYALAVQKLAIAVVAVDAHQNSGYLG